MRASALGSARGSGALRSGHDFAGAKTSDSTGAANRQAELIGKSHARSREYGLQEADEPDFTRIEPGRLRQAIEENRFLFQHAAPVMETLYEQIANTHSMIVLTSASGLVLHSLGDPDFLEKASRVALMPGADWSERGKGTNAIGTALEEEQPVTVHGCQHFLEANKFLTCSCAPIYDPHSRLIGALDVTGDHRSYQQHTLALVRMSAQIIENYMFADVFPNALRLHFHSRAEFLGTLVEGIAVFSPDGRFLAANRSACFQLGLSVSALRAHSLASLFGATVSELIDGSRSVLSTPKQLLLHNGVTVWARLEHKATPAWATSSEKERTSATRSSALAQESARSPARSAAMPSWRDPEPSLEQLDTGDARIAEVLGKVRRVLNRDIPILILGETGVGKDWLAQAIHRASSRAGQPFVAVNCAAIPETLIEAELFGYEEGAFTGARKKGSLGKILQAHGGTLFLDEIGDMPKPLQARLLRTLQERRVCPLGSNREIEVDVAIISATHRNLRSLIEQGEFREDLYYRLNGLAIKLPPLRERSDFRAIVRSILDSLATDGRRLELCPELFAQLARHRWPGNVRQLYNVLRTAVALLDRDDRIERRHLPEDFLEELDTHARPRPAGAAVGGLSSESLKQPGTYALHDTPGASSTEDATTLQDVELHAIAQALRAHHGNISAAAKALGVSRNTIYRKKHLLSPGLLA